MELLIVGLPVYNTLRSYIYKEPGDSKYSIAKAVLDALGLRVLSSSRQHTSQVS
jgi:hypothetical protein